MEERDHFDLRAVLAKFGDATVSTYQLRANRSLEYATGRERELRHDGANVKDRNAGGT